MRDLSPDQILPLVAALHQEGIRAFEITLPSPGLEQSIEAVQSRHPDVACGVGTVRSLDDLGRAAQAGAQFILTPHASDEIVIAARALRLPVIAGAFTPTEAMKMWSCGAAAVKLFPAEIGGAAYLRALRQPLPEIAFFPTGGVDEDNAAEYFGAGAAGLAIGGALTKLPIADLRAAARSILQTSAAAAAWAW